MTCSRRNATPRLKRKAFTLAELFISLAILGVIATFTIPKILNSNQAATSNARAKEVIASVSAAYQKYQLENTPTANTKPSDLLPYLNYVKLDTASVIDHHPGASNLVCSNTIPCIQLHNGGILLFRDESPFGGTTNNHTIVFNFDPDGVYSGGIADGPSKGIEFLVYFDGFTTDRGQAKTTSTSFAYPSFGPYAPLNPSWFHWN
jgi:prepilin-type N-terminal cleavage/methylation domain-containing protein